MNVICLHGCEVSVYCIPSFTICCTLAILSPVHDKQGLLWFFSNPGNPTVQGAHVNQPLDEYKIYGKIIVHKMKTLLCSRLNTNTHNCYI